MPLPRCPLRLLSPSVRCSALALGALLAACSSPGKRPADPLSPGPLTPAQQELLRDLELAYREQAKDYPERRAAIADDPVATAWFARMLIADVITAREGRPPSDEDDRLRAVAKIKDPVEARALDTLGELGAAAVPTVVNDLLRHPQALPREIGYELVARIGAPALPPLLELAADREVVHRRVAARALGLVGGDPTAIRALHDLARDGEFTVRAAAVRGLGTCGLPAAAAWLRECLQQDRDPFVRRKAAEALQAYPSRATAESLIDYLDRCERSEDHDGARAAQLVLRAFAKTRGGRTVPDWRRWLAIWQPPAER